MAGYQQGPTQDTTTLEAGMNAAKKQADDTYDPGEEANVKKWFDEIERARKFDENARKAYALDRGYARGDAGDYQVVVEIAQSYIDVLTSFLYARDPDLNIQPAPSTNPPPHKELEQQARDEIAAEKQKKTELAQSVGASLAPVVGQAMQSGALQSALPALVAAAGQGGQQEPDPETQARDAASQKAKPYQQKRQDAKQIAETSELVVSNLWKQAELKSKAEPLVRSALTVAIGWLKATWQERTNNDPTLVDQLHDLQEKLNALSEAQEDVAEGEAPDPEAAKADIQAKITGLQQSINQVIARGLAIDFDAAENIQVSTDVRTLAEYKNAGWIAHRTYIKKSEADATFANIDEKMSAAALYYGKKPLDPSERRDVGRLREDTVTAEEADSFTKGGSAEAPTTGEGFVLCWEIWCKSDGVVYTIIEGVPCYARKPYKPDPMTRRFYPFFQFAIGRIDNLRHPRSLIRRSCTLIDEYCAARSAWRRARTRAVPKVGFDRTLWEPDEIRRLEGATEQEFVGLKPVKPGANIAQSFAAINYARVDPALYDTAPIRAELETLWGVQEALSSSIHTAKTATEAEIQQTGTNSRTGYMRDGLDECLTDLAIYTEEIALAKLKQADVVRIAGPWALWPEGLNVNDLPTLIEIQIKAGSTGKPNTSQRQQVWATVMPVMKDAILQIGQLRNSTPDEIADCLEELAVETLNRTGDRIDAERFLPDAPPEGTKPPAPKGPPQPLADTALQGQQVQAMTTVLDQVKAGVLSPPSAIALLQACYPTVPPPLIQQMVNGAVPPPMPAGAPVPPMTPAPSAVPPTMQ